MPFEMSSVIEASSILCLLIGSFFCITGSVGIVRFPDFYTRMHAVGVSDTLGAGLILIGLMLQRPESIVVIKLLMILLMMLFINPAASHALAKTAIINGFLPFLENEQPDEKESNERGFKTSKP